MHVRLSNNFQQRSSSPVQVHITIAAFSRMNIFSRIFLQMRTSDADSLGRAIDIQVNPPVFANRLFVLRDLIALGQVWIEIVFTRKNIRGPNRTVQGQACSNGHFHGTFIDDWKRTWQSQANCAGLGIGRAAKFYPTPTKHFRLGSKLCMNFKTNDGFEVHN